jgi:short-subunit dehydrogenase
LILGATSDLGRAVARAYAAEGHSMLLAARDTDLLAAEASDLKVRFGVPVHTYRFDVLDFARHNEFLDRLGELPDTVVCLIGFMPDQEEAECSFQIARLVFDTNFSGPASILGEMANRMEARRSGTIIGVSSVAGDRGRARNYIYGAAKAGFTAFLSGLRGRLARKNVRVITVKPGFMRTRLTEGMTLPAFLTADPAAVAQDILSAHRRGRDIIYSRGRWRLVMAIIRALPEPIFKRLRI